MSKKLLIGGGVVVLILALLVWKLFANLDGIVAGIIEEEGTAALGS